jgi:homoserine kinase
VTIRTQPVWVRVPATSANLGPGFDALALALSLHDQVTARVSGSGLTVTVRGEGAGEVPLDGRHLVVRAMRAAFDALGVSPQGLVVDCANLIPQGRGLGSSAAAIVAGVLAARALVEGGDARLDDVRALGLAAELEGHPDNVAACRLGGLAIAWSAEEGVQGVRLPVDASLRPLVYVAPNRSSTAQVRRLLPALVPHRDAAANAGRAALLVHALAGRTDLLLTATEDRLHQPYRAPTMPDTAALVARLRSAGVPAVVSGAGPSVLALVVDSSVPPPAVAEPGWRVMPLAVDRVGAVVRMCRE